MKKMLIVLCMAAVCCCTPDKPKEPAFGTLTAGNHPRLFANNAEFAKMKKKIQKGDNEILNLLHENIMNLVENHGMSPRTIVYEKDASGKRLLAVSRETITRIFSDAYAFRFYGDEKYLHHAEEDLNAVCGFKDWNPSHYLDCAEMATAVAIGYDWLYPALQDSTKAKIVKRINEYAFDTASPETCWWYTRYTNWNQVCNAGLTCAALAIFETDPERCREMIERGIKTNTPAVESIYAPVGAYPEGPVYWNYGNMFQTLMLAELESTLGTDFGIGEMPGFSNTGVFQSFTIGNTSKLFNYYDNLPKQIPNYPLWYLAWRFNCPEVLYKDVQLLRSEPYFDIECERLLPLYIIYASRIDPRSIKPLNADTFFSEGSVPVAMVRTGWDSEDLYLGAKGGRASSAHGHIDSGEFVFDAYGVRWACDPGRQEYAELENPCKAMGGDFWNFSQNSVRWKLFRFSNFRHNTLTVNGMLHDVDAQVPMTARFEEPSRLGAAFDLTPLFYGNLSSAKREVSIRDREYLEVVDSLCGGSAVANVRWTLVGEGEPEITPGGIILRAKGRTMILSVEGAPVEYCVWPSDPAACNHETASFEAPIPEYICGFTLDVPAGEKLTLKTTIKKK